MTLLPDPARSYKWSIQQKIVKPSNTYVYRELKHHPKLWTLSMQHMLHAEAATFQYFHGATLAVFCV